MIRKKLYLKITFFSIVVITGYAIFNIYISRQIKPAEILIINPPSVESGNTTISGILRKDSPAGKAGKYILLLGDGSPVLLDIKGLDTLIGMKVFAIGYLYPATESNPIMSMAVTKITLE
jgi:hypothetical protein